MSNDHPTDDALDAYILRRQDAAAVELHLLRCESCRRRADDAETFIVAFRAAHASSN
jgi:predicted anti-sigma-YlaC factor YlaD